MIINRRQRVKQPKTRMPTVLRNLAPDTGLNPVTLWAAVKDAEPSSTGTTRDEVTVAGGGGGGSGTKKKEKEKKPKEMTKSEAIIQENEERRRALDMLNDWEKLYNIAKTNLKSVTGSGLPSKSQTVSQMRKELEEFESSIVSSMKAGKLSPSHLLSTVLEVSSLLLTLTLSY